MEPWNGCSLLLINFLRIAGAHEGVQQEQQMKHLLLASAATMALCTSLGVSAAQQAPGSRERPADQTPRSSQGDRTQQQRGPSAREEQTPPAARTGQNQDKQKPDRADSRSPSQAGDRPSAQQRNQPRRDEAREERSERADRDRSRGGRTQADRTRANEERERVTRDRASDDRGRDRARDRTTTGQSRESDMGRNRQDRADRRSPMSISDEQRVRISARFSERIDRMNVRPLSRSQISVAVGAKVPRSVHLYAVPREIVEIYPEFRRHRFVLVDDEIVIVEPSDYRVVAMLPRADDSRSSGSTTGAAVSGPRVRLTQDDRRVIRTVVMREPSCRLEQRLDFFIGIPLPRTVEICEFPEAIVSEVPEIRSYRYVVRGNEIVLVDPDEHRVVEVID